MNPHPHLPTRLSADDFGMSPGVNHGILSLAQKGVIRRVSLMADGPYLTDGLQDLCKIPQIELGLHFNLTFRKRHASPSAFLVDWMLHRKALTPVVRNEFQGQLQKLNSLRIPIHYVDGHHHIHIVPGVIDAVADLIHDQGIQTVRLPYDPRLWMSARFPLNGMALLARRRLQTHGFRSYRFIYPGKKEFQKPERLQQLFDRYPDAEFITHPASVSDFHSLNISDPYTDARVEEFQVLERMAHRVPIALKPPRR